jgi:hypothetical protein
MSISVLGISVDALDAARLANFWAQAPVSHRRRRRGIAQPVHLQRDRGFATCVMWTTRRSARGNDGRMQCAGGGVSLAASLTGCVAMWRCH